MMRSRMRQLSGALALGFGGLLCACGGSGAESPADRVDGGADVAPNEDAWTDSDTPANCPARTLLPDDVVARATAALTSLCAGVPDDGFYRTQYYLRGTWGGWSYPGGPEFVTCLANVTNGCEGVRDCRGFAWKSDAEVCGTCDGDTAVFCGDGLQARWDCGKYSGSCEGGLCSYPDLPLCDEGANQPSCDAEGRPSFCDDWLHVGLDCAAFGLACEESFTGRTGCTGVGTDCSGENNVYYSINTHGTSCQDDTMVTCQGGKEAEVSCPCFGQNHACQLVNGEAFCGVASECDPATFSKTCNGTSVVFCNAGKIESLDCVDLGFTECVPDEEYSCQTPCSEASECPSGHCYAGFCA